MGQRDWWWCHKCQGLFFAGNAGSVCPAGGKHERPPSGKSYVLALEGGDSGISVGTHVEPTDTAWGDSENGPGMIGTGHIIGAWAEAHWAGCVALIAKAYGTGSTGVQVTSDGTGVTAETQSGTGVEGHSTSGRGVWGVSQSFMGTVGDCVSGSGVFGHSQQASGVVGISDAATGVEGHGAITGGSFEGKNTGVQGIAHGLGAGVAGENDGEGGFGVWGRADRGFAGYFDGKVKVTDDIILSNGDCAEEFGLDETAAAPPGTVVVIDGEDRLRPSTQAYDRRVAGVVSGAGSLKPAILLGRDGSHPVAATVALTGKVFCKVDADYGPIEVGDLITSSPTEGHGMKAVDERRAFGAVLGKALRQLASGRGEIPILVCLH